MPVTDGNLTQRLGQMITDIGEFFSTVGDKLDTTITRLGEILATLRYLTSDTTLTPDTRNLQTVITNIQNARGPQGELSDLETIRVQIQGLATIVNTRWPVTNTELTAIKNAIGVTATDPSVRTVLRYLTQSADGTVLNRNIESLMGKLLDIQGERPNIATLWDLRQALVSPTGPRIQELVEKLDILLDEKFGVAPNALTLLELSQLIADCICSLDSKFLPLPPDPSPTTIPPEHLCAPNQELLFVIRQQDWYEWFPGLWSGAPATLYAGMEAWEIVQETADSQDGVLYPVLKVRDGMRDQADTFCRVTGSSQTEILTLLPQHGTLNSTPTGDVLSFSIGADVVGISDGPDGCKAIALLSSDINELHWRLQADLGGADNSDRPNQTIYFYKNPPV